MGLMSYDCTEIQNLRFQSLGAKTTGEIWISSLIRKLWDTAWDVRKYINRTLHLTDGPTKTEILRLINKRITYHLNRGMTGLPHICQFLFRTTTHTLLSRPVHQRLSWLAATSRVRWCSQRRSTRESHLDADKILLERITRGRLIPSLTQFGEAPPLRTTIGP